MTCNRMFEVTYTKPIRQIITIGVKATTKQRGTAKVRAAIEAGMNIERHRSLVLLDDDTSEYALSEAIADFEVREVGQFNRRLSVLEVERQNMAMRVCRMLVRAYASGNASGGSVDWADIDAAHAVAMQACKPAQMCSNSLGEKP